MGEKRNNESKLKDVHWVEKVMMIHASPSLAQSSVFTQLAVQRARREWWSGGGVGERETMKIISGLLSEEKVLVSECQDKTRIDGTRQLPSSGKSRGNGGGKAKMNGLD